MKNGKPTVVVLVPPALAILESRAKDRGGSRFVFPADSDSGHVVYPLTSWRRVVKRAGIDDLRPYDLRRSLGTWQVNLGASLPIIGKSLGHSDHKSTEVYARLDVGPVRESVNGAVQAMIEASGSDQGGQEEEGVADET